MALTLVVLAAGAARRYGSLKQLARVGPAGEALFEFAVFDAVRAGFDEVVLVIRPEHESTFRRRLDARLGRAVSLSYAFQTMGEIPLQAHAPGRAKPWGTGHAVLSTKRCVRGPFAVVNADDFYGRDAYRTMAHSLEAMKLERDRSGVGFLGAVMGYRVDQTLSAEGPVSRALLQRTEEERLLSVHELPAVERRDESIYALDLDGRSVIADDERVSMNMWGFEPSVFDRLEESFEAFLREADLDQAEFLLPAFVNAEIAAGRAQVDVLPAEGPWTGMTFEADREKTEGFLADQTARGSYPSPLWSG